MIIVDAIIITTIIITVIVVVIIIIICTTGIETKMNEDDDEEKKATIKEVDYHAHSKQTKKRLRHVQRQVSTNQNKKCQHIFMILYTG